MMFDLWDDSVCHHELSIPNMVEFGLLVFCLVFLQLCS